MTQRDQPFVVDRSRYYQASGQTPVVGLVITLTTGLIGAGAIAYLYAYADFYCPLLYANVLLTVAAGWTLGFETARAARLGKLRNPRRIVVIAVVIALANFVASWLIWLWIAASRGQDEITFASMLARPASFWEAFVWTYENGTWAFLPESFAWTSPGYKVHGPLLAIVWLGEAITLVGVTIVTAKLRVAARPFCEACRSWCDAPVLLHSYRGIISAAEVKLHLEACDWEFLALLPRPLYGELSRLELSNESCARCGEAHFLTLSRVTIPRNKKLVEANHRIELMQKLIVSTSELDTIRETQPYEPQASIESRLDALNEEDVE